MTDLQRPEILMTAHDHGRLRQLLAAWPRSAGDSDFLSEELDRAEVVAPAEIGHGVATMYSYLEFADDVTDRITRAILVYPGEEDPARGRIGVLSPLGAALIGLTEGQSIRWRLPGGGWRGLTLRRVFFQAWRGPPSSWEEVGRIARGRRRAGAAVAASVARASGGGGRDG